jgi:hypothetical protein
MIMGIESAADLAGMFNADEFATSVTYTPLVGDSSTISVIISPALRTDGYESRVQTDHIEIEFLRSDISTPKRGDQLDDGSTVYELISPIIDDGVVATWLVAVQ